MSLFHHCHLPNASYCINLCSSTYVTPRLHTCPPLYFLFHEPRVILLKTHIQSFHFSKYRISSVTCCAQLKIQTSHHYFQGSDVCSVRLFPCYLLLPPYSSPQVRTRQVVSYHSLRPLYVMFPLPGNFYTLTACAFLSSDRLRSQLFREATLSKIRCHSCLPLYLRTLFPFCTYSQVSITYFSYF